MTRWRPAVDGAITRRGALALLGAFAGCNAAPNPLSSDESAELDGAALRSLVAEAPPSILERLPVEIGSAHLAATERRARALLDAVPPDLGPDAIPNGAIRQRVRQAREHAAEAVDEAAAAPSPYERLSAFARARVEARFVAGAWRAIDEGLTREALADAVADVRRDRRALAARWTYVGADPVDATLVHAAIEERIDAARGVNPLGDPQRYRADNPLAVGEAAEDVERARVAVEDATRLYDRLVASLDDPTTLRSRLVTARESLRDEFEAERESLPSVDPDRPWTAEGRDVGETPVAGALDELYDPIDRRHHDGWADGPLAESVVWAHRSFVALGGFRSLRARVADGETFAVDAVADVASMRSAAVEAIRTAREAPSVPALTRGVLAEAVDRVGRADGRLANVESDVQVAPLRDEFAEYLVAAALARAAPVASDRVAAALRT